MVDFIKISIFLNLIVVNFIKTWNIIKSAQNIL